MTTTELPVPHQLVCSSDRARRRACGAGSPPSTTRRSPSCTARRRSSSSSLGGIEALLIRLQLAAPDGTLLVGVARTTSSSPCTARRWCSSSGMPIAAAFGNYLVPLMIGARDVAFPRLNMLGYWIFLFGGIFLYSSFSCFGGAPERRLVRTTRRSTARRCRSGFLPGRGPDFWAVGMIMLGIGSVATAVNFIVTILNIRAPGMTHDAHAGVRVDDARRRVPHAVRDAARHRGADPGLPGPQLRRELLQRGGRR